MTSLKNLFLVFSVVSFFVCYVIMFNNPSMSVEPPRPPNVYDQRMKIVFKKCSPKQTVVFLKTHKTGGTTLSRIIELYGYKHSLSFVRKIGERGSIHFGNRRFNSKSHHQFLPPHNVSKGNYSNYKYNIFTLHARYNRKVIDGFMKEDPIHITLLREPSKQFESAFVFFRTYKKVQLPSNNKSLSEKMKHFLFNPQNYSKAASVKYTNNDQIFDLGLNKKYFWNDTVINETIARIHQDMELVLINEYYDESLVILSKVLCWSLEDLVYLPKNERPETKKVVMSEEISLKAREWNHADTMLYNFFVERLHERIFEYGPSFEEDLRRFRNMTAELRRNCVGGQDVGGRRLVYKPTTNLSKECQYHTEQPTESDKRIRKLMLPQTYGVESEL